MTAARLKAGNTRRRLLPLSLAAALCTTGTTACGNVGGEDTIVHGDANTLVQDRATDRVAAELLKLEATPYVDDADVISVFKRIREDALDGDLDAALVLLRVAAEQRTLPE
ncbi:MAG: hypothetical protein AAF682_29680 [Planctomycetota bacterium]